MEQITQALIAALIAIITAIAGYLGVKAKALLEKFFNDKTKKQVVKTCVQAVEQVYKDLHGQEKYEKAVESISQILSDKGIPITELEIRMLVESAVGEFNNVFLAGTFLDGEILNSTAITDTDVSE